jgi:hypothetical protein
MDLRALVLAGLIAITGCAVSEDRPDLSCKSDGDCFRAQGETCDLVKHACVGPAASAAGPDASVAAPVEPTASDQPGAPAAELGGGAP